jgi:hypothetical protein
MMTNVNTMFAFLLSMLAFFLSKLVTYRLKRYENRNPPCSGSYPWLYSLAQVKYRQSQSITGILKYLPHCLILFRRRTASAFVRFLKDFLSLSKPLARVYFVFRERNSGLFCTESFFVER